MSRLVDIKSEKFWDVLFDEACVEGSQAERIENYLSKIAVSEQEIRNKAIDEFAEKMKEFIEEDMIPRARTEEVYHALTELQDYNIDEIAEQMKGGAK